MITLTCPWCEDDVPTDPDATLLDCAQCGVLETIAPDADVTAAIAA